MCEIRTVVTNGINISGLSMYVRKGVIIYSSCIRMPVVCMQNAPSKVYGTVLSQRYTRVSSNTMETPTVLCFASCLSARCVRVLLIRVLSCPATYIHKYNETITIVGLCS